jgi:hypothetical protein
LLEPTPPHQPEVVNLPRLFAIPVSCFPKTHRSLAGLALGLDSIKHTSIDIDVRTLTDYLLIKNTGMHGLPQDLWWVYKLFDPHALSKLHPKGFIIVDRQGRLGLGTLCMASNSQVRVPDRSCVQGRKNHASHTQESVVRQLLFDNFSPKALSFGNACCNKSVKFIY